jgi:hypothetical protein
MVTKELSEKLNKRGLGYIWDDPKEKSADRMCRFKERRDDIERHNLFADIRDKRSLIFIVI